MILNLTAKQIEAIREEFNPVLNLHFENLFAEVFPNGTIYVDILDTVTARKVRSILDKRVKPTRTSPQAACGKER